MPVSAKWVNRDEVMKAYALIGPNTVAALAGAQMKIAVDLADRIKARAPTKRTGRYRNSIHAKRLAETKAQPIGMNRSKDPNATGIFADFMWRFIEFGTRPHAIQAKRVPLLVFDGETGKVFVKSVRHPGASKQPHIFPTYRAQKKNIQRRLARTVKTAIAKALAQQQATEADGES